MWRILTLKPAIRDGGARSPVGGSVVLLVSPRGPRVLSGLGAEIVDRLLRAMVEVGHAAAGQNGMLLRLLADRRLAAAERQTVVVAVVAVPTLELEALVAHGELQGRGVRRQLQTERESVVNGGHAVLHRTTAAAARVPAAARRSAVLHVRAQRVRVRGPFVVRGPDEHFLVVRQITHFDRAHHAIVRRLDDHVLQRYVFCVQSLPEVQVTRSRL